MTADTAPLAIAALPERDLLLEMSRTLLWLGRRGLWCEWACTLPTDVVRELLAVEGEAAREALQQAMAEAKALDARLRDAVDDRADRARRVIDDRIRAAPMASWFPRRRCD